MKKTLLLCTMAFAGFAGMNAQTQPTFGKLQPTADVKTTLMRPSHNKLEVIPAPGFQTPASRGMEEHTADPKMLMNLTPTAQIGYGSMTCGKQISIATLYDADLTSRFAGNTLKVFYTALSGGTKKATFWIKKDLAGETLWESTVEGYPVNEQVGFECNYLIDGDPFYLGVTYEMSKVIGNKANIFFAPGLPNNNGFLIDAHDDYGWGDYSANGPLFFVCETDGEAGLLTNDIDLTSLTPVERVKVGNEYYITGSLRNYGSAPVLNFNATATLDGKTEEYALQLDTLDFNESLNFSIPVRAPKEVGRYTAVVDLTQVNGQPDDKPELNKALTEVVSLEKYYPRVAVMEEMTGTWCGWCPRGIAAMEQLEKDFPENYIGIAVHAGDVMETATYNEISYSVPGFPSAVFNRLTVGDPYYGLGEDEYGVTAVIQAIQNYISEAKVGLTSKLSADKKSIDVTSSVRFTYDAEECPYSISYVILEDGIQGFEQTNYYSSQMSDQTGITANMLSDMLLPFFSEGATYMPVFNHVAHHIEGIWGIEGSLSGAINSKEEKTHTMTLDVPMNVQDINKVSIVAMLMDNLTGEILTAAKAKVGETVSGIELNPAAANIQLIGGQVVVAAENATATVYNMGGQLVSSTAVNGSAALPAPAAKGVYIVKVEDGKNTTVKRILF